MEKKKFDLEDRTLKFSKECIDLCKLLGKNTINAALTNQLVRSATSVGANYREANDTTTKKDFYYKINICRREAKESKYWLELLAHANQGDIAKLTILTNEALELARIFSSIANKQKSIV